MVFRIISPTLCFGAALSMAISPAAAADLPVASSVSAISQAGEWADGWADGWANGWDADAVNAERYRRYRHGRHHRNRGVDAGDVLTGVLILGGIAAIADAVSNRDRDDRYRRDPARYRDRTGSPNYDNASGLDRAVSMCRNAIEADARVESVDSARRTGSGWNVTGRLFDGAGFACSIDNNGRISDISYGDGLAAAGDRQYDDDRYRTARLNSDQARLAQGGTVGRTTDTGYQYAVPADSANAERLPAYPGGPVDGDIIYDDDTGN